MLVFRVRMYLPSTYLIVCITFKSHCAHRGVPVTYVLESLCTSCFESTYLGLCTQCTSCLEPLGNRWCLILVVFLSDISFLGEHKEVGGKETRLPSLHPSAVCGQVCC